MFPLLLAQITPAQQTIVNQVQQEFFIEGGELNGTNLFHSFQDFGLTESQIATFMANPELQNILVRVVNRRDPSFIDGLLQVSGGSPNLFFINPAGVIFGENAQVNVPASFIVGTSTAIDFPDARWSTSGLGGTTSALPPSDLVFSFTAQNPVINLGQVAAVDRVFFAGRNVQSFGSVIGVDFAAVTLPRSIFTFAVGLDTVQTRTTLPDTSFIFFFDDWEDFGLQQPFIGDVDLTNVAVESSIVVDSGRGIALTDSQAAFVDLVASPIGLVFVQNVDAVFSLTASGWEVSVLNSNVFTFSLPDIDRCGVPNCWVGIDGHSGNIPEIVFPPEPPSPEPEPPSPEPELPDPEPEPPSPEPELPDPEPEPPSPESEPPSPEPELPDPEPEPPSPEPEPEFQFHLPAVSDFVRNPQPRFLKTDFYFSQDVSWCLAYHHHLADIPGQTSCLLRFQPPSYRFPQEITESQFFDSIRRGE